MTTLETQSLTLLTERQEAMTRRERLEAKAEKRREWAEKADRRSSQRLDAARGIADNIPFGQPILVGHHSEKRARRDIAKIDNNMRKGVEESDLADHHRSKAEGLEYQLAGTIFSDDDDAIEALEQKIAGLEASRDAMKRANKEAGKPLPLVNYPQDVQMTKEEYKRIHKDYKGSTVVDNSHRVRTASMSSCPDHSKAHLLEGLTGREYWNVAHGLTPVYLTDSKTHERPAPIEGERKGKPYASYQLTNIGAQIRQAKERIEQIKRQQVRTAEAEEAGGVHVRQIGESCSITFAEKPDREVINVLKAKGFYWSSGSWHGKTEDIPEDVQDMTGRFQVMTPTP